MGLGATGWVPGVGNLACGVVIKRVSLGLTPVEGGGGSRSRQRERESSDGGPLTASAPEQAGPFTAVPSQGGWSGPPALLDQSSDGSGLRWGSGQPTQSLEGLRAEGHLRRALAERASGPCVHRPEERPQTLRGKNLFLAGLLPCLTDHAWWRSGLVRMAVRLTREIGG